MARIPDATSFGARPSVRQPRPIISYTPEKPVDFGGAIFKMGAEIQQGNDRLEYAKAKSEFLKAKIEADNAFDEDQDYATWADRYQKQIDQTRQKIAGSIRNGSVRQLFEADAEVDATRGLAGIRDKARAKERDVDRAGLTTLLGTNKDLILQTADDATREGLITSTNDAIEALVAKGSLSATEGAQQRQQWVAAYRADRDKAALTGLTGYLDQQRNGLMSNPGNLDNALADIEGRIAASGLTESAKEKIRLDAKKALGLSAVQGEIQRDPNAALGTLNSGKLDGILDADNKAALLGAANTEIRRRKAEADQKAREAAADARTEVSLSLNDEIASIRATGQSSGLLSPDLIRRAFPNDPGKADQIIRQVENEKQFYVTRQAVALTTPEDDARVLADFQARSTGPGAAQITQQASHYQDAIRAKRQALKQDPAAYVLTASESVRAAQAEAATDPAKMQRYATLSLETQAQLGVPDNQRKILTDAQADEIAARFKTQPAGGENAATLMQSLAQQWGPLWGQVYGELAKGEKLPGTTTVIGSMPPGRAASALAEAVNIGDKTLAQALPSQDAKAVKDGVAGELEDFRASIMMLPGGAAAYGNYAKSTEVLALKYAGEGMKPTDALRKAARDVVTDRYEFRGTYRVPKEQPVDEIDAGAAAAMRADKIPADKIDVPRSGMPDDLARKAYLAQVAKRGFWVTAPDESGLVLYDETQSAVTVGGQPYRLTWAELRGMGAAEPTAGIKDPATREAEKRLRDDLKARRAAEPDPIGMTK